MSRLRPSNQKAHMILDVQFIMGADPDAPVTQAIVTKVHDGDTPSVQEGSIRMLGMDAPELAQAPHGQAARIWLTKQILNRTIELRKDTHARDRDMYGRMLRWVYVDTLNLNVEAVRLGLAVKYIIGHLDYATELEMYEAEVRAKKLGVWSDPNFILPSEYRKAKKHK